MAPTAFEKAEGERTAISEHLELLQSVIDDHPTNPLSYREAVQYLDEVVETRKLIGPNHTTLLLSAPRTTDMAPYKTAYHALIKLASKVDSALYGIKMDLTPTTQPPADPAAQPAAPRIKLPPLELPKFNGTLQDWIPFRDMFITAVHSTALSKIDKLTQLKSLLTGEASRVVHSMKLTEDNYDIAWKALQERYTNNRELVFSYLKRLLNQPNVTTRSTTALRSLVDTTKEILRSLEVMGRPVEHWDDIVLYTLFTKLDPSSRELWERALSDTEVPTLEKMYEFIEQSSRAIAASSATSQQRPLPKGPQQQIKAHHASARTCRLGCSQGHPTYKCPQFTPLDPKEKYELVVKHKLCRNCLCEGHGVAACPSQRTCFKCNGKHHTQLHRASGPNQDATPNASGSHPASFHVAAQVNIPTGILATASIRINSSARPTRALIDGGSTNTQVTRKVAKRLQLSLQPVSIPMTGPGEVSCGTIRHVTTLTFKPWFDSAVSFTTVALVVDKISGNIPSSPLQTQKWKHLTGLQLADPEFHKPDAVEVLLGTDLVWDMLDGCKMTGSPGQPTAIKTSLGWLVAGANATATSRNPQAYVITADLEHQLRRFITQEEDPEPPRMTAEEMECERYFAATHYRDAKGQFHVSIPYKSPEQPLGSSKEQAERRFLSLENRYNADKCKDTKQAAKLREQWNGYKKFMDEYLALGHMELIPENEVDSPESYYIPHHAVFKESSTTTKLRVVFDASAKTSNGTSLNDTMMVGPQLQDGIPAVMLRFRRWPIAFIADMEKMYRMILVALADANKQRIVWRPSRDQPLRYYRLLTLTYGTAAAAYLAIKCLQQLAIDEKKRFPKASATALKEFYVDDLSGSRPDVTDSKQTVSQMIDMCASASMTIRKWTTNSTDLLESIPEELREQKSLVELEEDGTVKTLGVYWDTNDDIYKFKLTLPNKATSTKRTILSEIAKIFDPLGLLAPAVICCKIFMQELWLLKHDWDDLVPLATQQRWDDLRSSLQELERITIPRCVIPQPASRLHLIGCSDASVKAISACVYLASEYDASPTTCRLLTAKTKVAPLKPVTLPRLELNAAVLLAKLMSSVKDALELTYESLRAFTDSTITLHWIQSNPTRWKTYVRNRVQRIQETVPDVKWFHIPGGDNPADCASRGIPAADLLDHPLWWNGSPAFFTTDSTCTDLINDDLTAAEIEVQKSSHQAKIKPTLEFIGNSSHFLRLQRTVAYMQRFVSNCRILKAQRSQPAPCDDKRSLGPLTTEEILSAHNAVMTHIQQSCFAAEYELLRNGHALPTSHALISLSPFVAADGLLRVGGRLQNANVPYDQKHPILLPKGHHATTLVIMDYHLRLQLHAGPAATLNALQQRYWITDGLNTVKAVVRRCVRCTRQRAATMKQLMGSLPAHRVNEARPFSKVGVDYAGPFIIKPMVRSKVTLKCWFAIFVCLVTRAIHIEIVSSFSTPCFLAALRRFISRRGRPTDVYSDCGTNFKGADKVIRDFFTVSRQAAVQDECSSNGISWHFIPPPRTLVDFGRRG